MKLIFYQKALRQEVIKSQILSEAITQIYTYRPIDEAPPYIFIEIYNFTKIDNRGIQYGDMNVFLITRESGLIQSSQLNSELFKLLCQKMTFVTQDKEFKFIYKIQTSTYVVDSDGITKNYSYQGRLKIKERNTNVL